MKSVIIATAAAAAALTVTAATAESTIRETRAALAAELAKERVEAGPSRQVSSAAPSGFFDTLLGRFELRATDPSEIGTGTRSVRRFGIGNRGGD